ncbi:hypothetical protein [Streptomyces sp. NBC_00158]|uniref:hypothetical protein n=1 Tax=Streptomyces sp. NBC_00158 TaxID=2903627 RepID=UPI00325587A4
MPQSAPPRAMWPLYAAGSTTAFGAHGIAANLGGFSEDAVTSLLVLGGLPALYDGAEVVLKPGFGTLADRIGAKPVLLGGVLVWAAGLRLLFLVMAACGAAVAVWAVLAVPAAPPLPKFRQTVADLVRRLADCSFLAPTGAPAAPLIWDV